MKLSILGLNKSLIKAEICQVTSPILEETFLNSKIKPVRSIKKALKIMIPKMPEKKNLVYLPKGFKIEL